jgi:hypothetical protein
MKKITTMTTAPRRSPIEALALAAATELLDLRASTPAGRVCQRLHCAGRLPNGRRLTKSSARNGQMPERLPSGNVWAERYLFPFR